MRNVFRGDNEVLGRCGVLEKIQREYRAAIKRFVVLNISIRLSSQLNSSSRCKLKGASAGMVLEIITVSSHLNDGHSHSLLRTTLVVWYIISYLSGVHLKTKGRKPSNQANKPHVIWAV